MALGAGTNSFGRQDTGFGGGNFHHLRLKRSPGMRCVTLVTVLLAAVTCVAIASVCDESRCPDGYECNCVENYAEEIDSDVTVNEHVLIFSQDEWNKTESTTHWTVSEEVSTTHSWSVTACANTTLRSGMLTKVVADGEVGVEVGGEYSGSKSKTRTVAAETDIPECRGYGRREYIDDYACDASQVWWDRYLHCWNPDDPVQECNQWEGLHDLYGDSSGDTNKVGEFIDLGSWHQSSDACKACCEAS